MRLGFLVHLRRELRIEGNRKDSADFRADHRECLGLHSENGSCKRTLEMELKAPCAGHQRQAKPEMLRSPTRAKEPH